MQRSEDHCIFSFWFSKLNKNQGGGSVTEFIGTLHRRNPYLNFAVLCASGLCCVCILSDTVYFKLLDRNQMEMDRRRGRNQLSVDFGGNCVLLFWIRGESVV